MKRDPVPNVAGEQDMTARELLRRQVAYLLLQKSIACEFGWEVQEATDWPTPPEKLPAVLISATRDSKQSWTDNGAPAFNTTVTVVVEYRGAQKLSYIEAQMDVDKFCRIIEREIFTNYNLVQAVQQFVSANTNVEITAEGRYHQGAFKMSIDMQVPEVFDPFSENG